MRFLYYRRDGTPCDNLIKLAKDFENPDKRIVKQTLLSNGKWVSTVWLGINHNWPGDKPLIFETMVFPNQESLSDLDSCQYSTEAEALEGHEKLCKEWKNK